MDKELTWIEEGLSDLLARGDYPGESADARAARYIRLVLYHRGGVRIGNAATARDHILSLLAKSGAIRIQEVLFAIPLSDGWEKLAVIDRLVEMGDLREIPQEAPAGQHRIFVKA